MNDAGESDVVGVATLFMRHVSDTVEGVRNLLLASSLGIRVADLAKNLHDQVLAEARTEGIDVLTARGPMRVTAPGPNDAGRARSS